MNLILKAGFVSILVISIIASGCGNTSIKDRHSSVQQSDTGTAVITFKEYEHDFGKVAAGEKVGCFFSFENTGTGSLVIASVTTSCGCTVPKYNTKPITPGEQGGLEIIFDTSGRNGRQAKTIVVKSNASSPSVLLKIVADVVSNNNK